MHTPDPPAQEPEIGAPQLPSAGWRRRPAGEPPPLPRGSGWRGWAWATLALLVVGILVRVAVNPETGEGSLLRWFEDLRTPELVDAAKAFDMLTDPLVIWIIRVAVVLVAVFYKRWRHIVTFLALLIVVDYIVTLLNVDRPPPPGVRGPGGRGRGRSGPRSSRSRAAAARGSARRSWRSPSPPVSTAPPA